jgi:hypothetical protein
VGLLAELYIHHDTHLRSSELCFNVQNNTHCIVQPLVLLLAYLSGDIEPHTLVSHLADDLEQ